MACREQHSAAETCPQCEFDPFVRNHFFTGKLMGAADFVAESFFHGEKMRHHNIRLHGWGVVCGLKVRQHDTPQCQNRYVVVQPGSALDCCGHEILVPEAETIDVASHPLVQSRTNDGRLHTLQIAACYRECPTEDVPVLYDDCGCDDSRCAPNRILESYALDVLVDPPLASGLGGGAATGAFVAAQAAGAVTGYMQSGAGGRIAIVDPANSTRVFVLDPQHRSMVTVALPAAALAIAMRQNGNSFVVATVPAVGGAPECLLRVYKTADGSEIAPAVRLIPNSTAASRLTIATTADAARSVVVFDATQGLAYRWKDAPNDDIAAVAGSVNLGVGATAFTALADGTLGFVIDPAGKVQVAGLGAGPAVAPLQWNPAKGDALAAFTLGAAVVVAVAAKDEKRVYLVEQQAGGAHASIDLEHTPVMLGVTGPAASPWLIVYEADAGHGYVQSVLLPANVGGNAVIGAGRASGGADPQIVVLYADGQAATVDPAAVADNDCASLVCKQSCEGCDVPECVVLATVVNYMPGFAFLNSPSAAGDLGARVSRLDGRYGRRNLASTATLQAWLECLQLKGGVPGPQGPAGPQGPGGPAGGNGEQGPQGDPGVLDVQIKVGNCQTKPKGTVEDGTLVLELPKCCDEDLTHICAINWVHGKASRLAANLREAEVIVAFDGPIVGADVGAHSFRVEIGETHPVPGHDNFSVTCWCQLDGDYSTFRLADPMDLTGNRLGGDPNAMAFKPKYGLIALREYRVTIVGDFIRDLRPGGKGKAIDADHLPPWLGRRPTGDCIEGGTFLSWFAIGRAR